MKKLIILSAMLVLAGCSTIVPVANVKFPDAPGKMATERCPTLKQVEENAKLSDVGKTVTINYSTYYDCAVKHDAWVEWYEIQKEIFNRGQR